jgi:selenocysteine lyase/cysteine desulfurase
MTFDIKRARSQTPGCEHVIHFNNAGASLAPQVVLDEVTKYLEYESIRGGYEAAAENQDKTNNFYNSISKLINAKPNEIAYVENATRAWDMAFYSIPLKSGDRILTSMAEYASNYIAFLQVAKRTGAIIEPVPNDAHGQISTEALTNMIDERVKLIAITHIPTNGGLVNPAAQVGKIAHNAGVLYLLDSCQAAGQMPLDVNELDCDFLTATGRKYLRGPRGTGFLYVRQKLIEALEPPFLDLFAADWVAPDRIEIRKDAKRFETWERNVAAMIGLGVASDYAMNWGLENIRDRVWNLADSLRAKLNEISGIVVRDLGIEKCGIVSFTVDDVEPGNLRELMTPHKININYSSRISTRLDMDDRNLDDLARASIHYYNTDEEIDRFCDILESELINMRSS